MTATAGCHPPVLMGVQGLGAAPVWPADIPQGVTFFPPGAGEMLPSLALLPGGTAAGSKARRCNAKLDTVTGRAAVLWVQLQPPPRPGTVRSSTTAAPCRKAKPSKEQLGQESSYRGSARGVRRRAGAGTGGERGGPTRLQPVRWRGTETPGTASDAPPPRELCECLLPWQSVSRRVKNPWHAMKAPGKGKNKKKTNSHLKHEKGDKKCHLVLAGAQGLGQPEPVPLPSLQKQSVACAGQPGELPACSRHTALSHSRWKGAAAAPHRSPLPAASTAMLRATALLADWATFLRATQPCASPAHTTGDLFAELQLIYGPCYLNINYGPARQAPRLLPSRLIIF